MVATCCTYWTIDWNSISRSWLSSLIRSSWSIPCRYPLGECDNRHGRGMANGTRGYPTSMSDFEHDLILEFQETRDEADELRSLAQRALVAASTAQEAAYGRHDAWIDEAMRETVSTS